MQITTDGQNELDTSFLITCYVPLAFVKPDSIFTNPRPQARGKNTHECRCASVQVQSPIRASGLQLRELRSSLPPQFLHLLLPFFPPSLHYTLPMRKTFHPVLLWFWPLQPLQKLLSRYIPHFPNVKVWLLPLLPLPWHDTMFSSLLSFNLTHSSSLQPTCLSSKGLPFYFPFSYCFPSFYQCSFILLRLNLEWRHVLKGWGVTSGKPYSLGGTHSKCTPIVPSASRRLLFLSLHIKTGNSGDRNVRLMGRLFSWVSGKKISL